MSLSELLNKPCTIVSRSDEGDIDAYGVEIPTETETATVCELQQERRDEPDDAGELSITTWMLFLPHNTRFKTGDAVIVGTYTYEAVGDSWNAEQGSVDMWHVEARVKRTAGDDELGS